MGIESSGAKLSQLSHTPSSPRSHAGFKGKLAAAILSVAASTAAMTNTAAAADDCPPGTSQVCVNNAPRRSSGPRSRVVCMDNGYEDTLEVLPSKRAPLNTLEKVQVSEDGGTYDIEAGQVVAFRIKCVDRKGSKETLIDNIARRQAAGKSQVRIYINKKLLGAVDDIEEDGNDDLYSVAFDQEGVFHVTVLPGDGSQQEYNIVVGAGFSDADNGENSSERGRNESRPQPRPQPQPRPGDNPPPYPERVLEPPTAVPLESSEPAGPAYITLDAGYVYNATKGSHMFQTGVAAMKPISKNAALGLGLNLGFEGNEPMTVVGPEGDMHPAWGGRSTHLKPQFRLDIGNQENDGPVVTLAAGVDGKFEHDATMPDGVKYIGGKGLSAHGEVGLGWTVRNLTEWFGARFIATGAVSSPTMKVQGTSDTETEFHAGAKVQLIFGGSK